MGAACPVRRSALQPLPLVALNPRPAWPSPSLCPASLHWGKSQTTLPAPHATQPLTPLRPALHPLARLCAVAFMRAEWARRQPGVDVPHVSWRSLLQAGKLFTVLPVSIKGVSNSYVRGLLLACTCRVWGRGEEGLCAGYHPPCMCRFMGQGRCIFGWGAALASQWARCS